MNRWDIAFAYIFFCAFVIVSACILLKVFELLKKLFVAIKAVITEIKAYKASKSKLNKQQERLDYLRAEVYKKKGYKFERLG